MSLVSQLAQCPRCSSLTALWLIEPLSMAGASDIPCSAPPGSNPYVWVVLLVSSSWLELAD
jgi:hypothetical protein